MLVRVRSSIPLPVMGMKEWSWGALRRELGTSSLHILNLQGLVVVQSLNVSNSLQPHRLQNARLPHPSSSPGACSNLFHWVGDAIQPSCPLLSPSPPASNLSQHRGLFKRVRSSLQVAKVLELQLQHQSFQWIFRIDFLWDWLVWSPCCPRGSQESSPTPQFKSINSSALSLLYGPTLLFVPGYWKSVQFSSVQSLSCVWLFAAWTAAHQAFLSITNSKSPPKPLSIESVMPSSHLILCRHLFLLPSIFPSIKVFSNESALRMRWSKYWSFNFNISPSNEHPGLISSKMDWLDLLTVQGTLKSLLQHHSQKHQFFSAQLSSQSNSHIYTWPLKKP